MSKISDKAAKNLPNGGAVVDENNIMVNPADGGMAVGRAHSENGIKAINKATNSSLEFEGGEVIITKPAVEDNELREFEGQMLTNRQILSKINESGGGVSFAEKGAELPTELYFSGNMYNFRGETISDHEIAQRISKCGCSHEKEFEEGGIVFDPTKKYTIEEIDNLIQQLEEQRRVFVSEKNSMPKLIKLNTLIGDVIDYRQSLPGGHLQWVEVFPKTKKTFADGGYLPTDIPQRLRDDISLLISLKRKKENGLRSEYDINLIKNAFYNKVKKLPIIEATVILDYLTELEKTAEIKPIFTSNHKIWENYIPQIEKPMRKPKYKVDDYVYYKNGDLDVEYWVGKIVEVKDFDNEYGYRIDAYSNSFTNPAFDSYKTNEKFEIQLKPSVKRSFDNLKEDYERRIAKKNKNVIELTISPENNLSKQLIEYTGDQWNAIDFENVEKVEGDLTFTKPFIHKKTGKQFVVVLPSESSKTNRPIPELTSFKNPYEVNRAIEQLLDTIEEEELTSAEKAFISHYSGYGGLEKFGSFSDNELKGLLYEYYTPDAIVKKMWALAYKYGFGIVDKPKILEPSVGTGNFFKYAPQNAELYANEINSYSKRICEILYPNANVSLQPFEKNFIERNLSIKGKLQNLQKYNLVIGNPPYGEAKSKYLSMGESDYTKAGNFTEYFITRGLDLLLPGGLLIYVVGAEQYNGGTLFLDSGPSQVKAIISEKAQLLDAYRLPTKIFERTGVASEIVVFKKNNLT